jgi:hypothetical protein
MEILGGVLVQGVGEMREMELQKRNALMPQSLQEPVPGGQPLITYDEYGQEKIAEPTANLFTSSLAGHILQEFNHNKDARRNSLVEEGMMDDLRAYNGEYNPQDLQKIKATGGSEIFINITGVKARAAASWIRDILLPAKEKAWSLEPTPKPDLPKEMMAQIQDALDTQFEDYVKFIPEEEQKKIQEAAAQAEGASQKQLPGPQPQAMPIPQGGQAPAPIEPPQAAVEPGAGGTSNAKNFSRASGTTGEPGQQAPVGASQKQVAEKAAKAAQTLKEFNQARRDIEDMVLTEINKIAKHEMLREERKVEDQLAEGKWDSAFSDFIDDFVVFPFACIKGPIISKDDTLSYVNGKAVPSRGYVYKNKRISPFDIYPSPNATSVNDGTNFIEHCRFTRRELSDLVGLPGYKAESINKVLEEYAGSVNWLDTGIEGDKAIGERRGDEWQANRDIVHGLHFHGSISVKTLREWDIKDPEVLAMPDTTEVEVEAIIAGEYAIRCVRNKDPLRRRPYYKASFQARPGSFYGKSLPSEMSDIQRMCNAASRALSNNMGLASGPQIEVYVDRLADNGDITNIHPFKIWQLTSDPTGAGGRAINFTQPTSNASELLAVYKEFELRADDATGIPKYAYGNERVGGAAATAQGLAMLLDSASKAIKDCVRNIDQNVIIPRVEYQFYWNVVSDPYSNYTGDPKVIGRGSSALTLKGSEQMRRNEFLQITANQIDQQIMGLDGRAEILRAIAEDLNLSENVIPSRLELKAQQAKAAEAAAQQQQTVNELEKAKVTTGLQATKEQIGGQERMHQQTQQFKMMELQKKEEAQKLSAQLSVAKLEAGREAKVSDGTAKLQQTQYQEEGKNNRFQTEVALKLKRGEGI